MRRQFDWGHYPPDVDANTRKIDRAICEDAWRLEVDLRRQVEAALVTRDAERAGQLRPEVEGAAGALAAALDIGRALDQQHDDWDQIAEWFDAACNQLHELLRVAGPPRAE